MPHGAQETVAPAASLDLSGARKVATTLQALASPNRLLILARLRRSPCTVTEISAAIDMAPPQVSHQLRLLRALGLVVGERSGRSVLYRLHDDHVALLLDQSVYHIEHRNMGIDS